MICSKLNLFIFCSLLITQIGFSQDATYFGKLKGVVSDELTLEKLAFSTIYIKELSKGTTADESGTFELDQIPEGNYIVTISFLGYNEKSVTDVRIIRNKTTYYDIELTQNVMAMEQVEVTAFKYENISSMPNSTFSMSREEIFRSPASNGNIFRAISTLPGVQSGGGSFAALAVRGQGTEENATFVDEFPVFELSHLAGGGGGFDDPNGGRFSIFGPRAVDGLVLQTGGFAALYGRRSSAFMNLNIKEGNPENSEIDGIVSLTGPSLSYSGPLTKKTRLYASVRYQNFVPALTLTKQADLGFPSFFDLTMKLTSNLTEKTKLTFIALFNPEKFERTRENIVKDGNVDNNYENNFLADVNNAKGLLGLKFKSQMGKKSSLTNMVYFRFKSTDTSFGLAYPIASVVGTDLDFKTIAFNAEKGVIDNTENEIGVRSIYSNVINESLSLKAGLDLARMQIDHRRFRNASDTIYSFYRSSLPLNQVGQNYLVLSPENYNSIFEGSGMNASVYVNALYHHNSRLSANIGLRMDFTEFSDEAVLSPRFNVNYRMSEKTSLTYATGIYYQDPLNIFVADNNGETLQHEKAIHYILGLKHHFNSDLKLTVEGYYKSFSNLIVRPNPSVNKVENIGDGAAYGIDLSLVKRLSNKFNSQISYSYSQSTRDNHDGVGEYDHLYSQPHIFNFLIGYQPNSKWIFSTKIRYSTGQPTNSSLLFTDVFQDPNFVRFGQELTGRHDIRNEYFLGIDLRIDRRFQFNKFAITGFLDIQNLTNRENAAARTFYEITGSYKPMALGILPTVGWRFEF